MVKKWIATGRIPEAQHASLRWLAANAPADVSRAIHAAAAKPTSTTTSTSTLTSEEKAIARRLGVSEVAMMEQKAKAAR